MPTAFVANERVPSFRFEFLAPPGWGLRARLREDDAQLEASVERDRQARECWIGLTRLRIRAQSVRVQRDVVRDHERGGLELAACELEELFVLLVPGVEEHDVEHVVDRR